MPVIVPVLAAMPPVVLALAGAVQWQAPPGCPEAAAVEQRVEDLLGRTPDEDELRAVGVVHAGPPWQLELETTIGGARQRRSLQGDDCRAVAEAAALILAVSVDPLQVAGETASSDARSSPPPAVPPSPLEPPPVAAGPVRVGPDEPRPASASPLARPRPRLRPRLRLRVGGGAETGAIPQVTGGVRLGVALEGERAVLQLEGTYWIDRLAVLREDPSPIGATVGLGTVTAQGGVRLGSARVSVPLVVGLEAGGLRSAGVRLTDGQQLTLPWLAGVVGAGVQWAMRPRVALWGAVEGVVPLVRPQLRVGREDGSTRVLHEPAVVGARALVGLSFMISRDP